ncbi:hypothetical protein DSO57_1003296 [Entomophthora muscae]|uniref:Uncharacterized protein n=1 Tax=Entomophthora muscae TaxID=34485 RepID=A0ACC2T8B6_9FUNG|nr:hypothetical protein DSO57_1003296 [Entomophthora muscae]
MQPMPNNFTPDLSFQGNLLPSDQQAPDIFNSQMIAIDQTLLEAPSNAGGFYAEASQINYAGEFLAPLAYYTPPCYPVYMSPFSSAFSPMFQPFLSLPNSANLHPMNSTCQNFPSALPPDGDLVLPQSAQTIPSEGPLDTFDLDSGPETNHASFASDFKPVILMDPSACNRGSKPVATVTSMLAPKIVTPLGLINPPSDQAASIETPSSLLARNTNPSNSTLDSQDKKKCNECLNKQLEAPVTKESIQLLQQKSNYCHIAEGTSSSLGLQYDTNFEQQVKRKRQHHQKSEQQRRAVMAAKFKQLATTIYNANPNSELVSQSDILAATIQHLENQKKQHAIQSNILLYLRNRFNIPTDSEEFPHLPETLPHVSPEKGLSDSEFIN